VDWHHPTSPWEKQLKVTPSAGIVIATIFWVAEGLILVGIVSRGKTINSDLYILVLDRCYNSM
jgi:hypothetical protein